MSATDIVAYTYKAEQLHDECLREVLGYGTVNGRRDPLTVEERLNSIAKRQGIDREDEYSFDSDDFPKVIFESQLDCGREGQGDHEQCDRCGETLCGFEYSDSLHGSNR